MEAKKTPLYEVHKELGAKIVEFAGYLMPVWYEGIRTEALTTRKSAGLFDISHMGRILVKGRKSFNLIQRLVPRDISKLSVGQVFYTFLCNENGGVIDDILVYRLGKESYILVVNAANLEKDLNWLRKHQKKESKIFPPKILFLEDSFFLAIQGPKALEVLRRVGLAEASLNLKYYHCRFGGILAEPAVISRTGYTGEDGFEIMVFGKEKAEKIWNQILADGQDLGIKPVGIAARDTLRLEAGMPLYGHELFEEITPLEAGLERFISFDKSDFIGRQALVQQQKEGAKKKLVGFEVLSGRIVHQGYPVLKSGEIIGQVASGIISPILNKSIGTAFVKTEFVYTEQSRSVYTERSRSANFEDLIEIDIRGQKHQAKIVGLPFYKRG